MGVGFEEPVGKYKLRFLSYTGAGRLTRRFETFDLITAPLTLGREAERARGKV